MSHEELNNLRNKEELYTAATSWVRVRYVASNHWPHIQLGRDKCSSSGAPQPEEKNLP